MLIHRKGNVIDLAEQGEFDVIVHGCNCFNTMGSGMALEIRDRYPQAYNVDAQTQAGDIGKLGNWTISHSDNKIKDMSFHIINAYTQFRFKGIIANSAASDDVFEYDAFGLILRKLAHKLGHKRFGFPYIGTGLAGGNKERIIDMLEDFAIKCEKQGGSVTLVEFASK